MGYTHYATRPKNLPARKFRLAAEDCRKVVETLCQEKGFRVQWESDDTRPPQFSKDGIRFNGEDELGHETFAVDRLYIPYDDQAKPARGDGWVEFTKTARKPYDAAVCACLVVLHHHFGKMYSVSSDGTDGDDGWVVARECCQRVLGYGADFTLRMPPRMTRQGLALLGNWYSATHAADVRQLSNGWELRKRSGTPFKYTVRDPDSQEHPEHLAHGHTIREVVWKATVTYFRTTFPDTPYFGEFEQAMLSMRGEWSTFLAWSDKLQDNGHEDIARKIREHLPQ
ncbi:MAG: hypothetical protein K8U57_17860 [Planctomycetes bacterium]|nr:hypothetical protein [Planctomycetota bacterium]